MHFPKIYIILKRQSAVFGKKKNKRNLPMITTNCCFFLTLPLTGLKLPLTASILPLKLMAMFMLVIAIWILLLAMNVLVIDT